MADWFVIQTQSNPTAWNMACDEYLMRQCISGELKSGVLRLYFFSDSSYTMGYGVRHQQVDSDPEAHIIRRLTGGGVVAHGDDIGFSLIMPQDGLFRTVQGSYQLVHQWIQQSLSELNISSNLFESCQNHNKYLSTSCFETPIKHDLMAEGVKIAGGAQRRLSGWVLHQGSLAFHKIESQDSPDVLFQSMIRCAGERFKINMKKMELSKSDENAIRVLCDEKYMNDTWNRKR